MSNIVYVHNKETGEVSRKPFDEVDQNTEFWYAYEGDAKRPVVVNEAGDVPNDAEVYLHGEGKQDRPVRSEVPD